jgi:hypothetical protein
LWVRDTPGGRKYGCRCIKELHLRAGRVIA